MNLRVMGPPCSQRRLLPFGVKMEPRGASKNRTEPRQSRLLCLSPTDPIEALILRGGTTVSKRHATTFGSLDPVVADCRLYPMFTVWQAPFFRAPVVQQQPTLLGRRSWRRYLISLKRTATGINLWILYNGHGAV